MGKVVVIEHLSLDGVMQGPGGPDEDRRGGFQHGGWAQAGNDPVMYEVLGQRMSADWALLVGRRTYEQFADYWPKQVGNPFSEALTNVNKYVVSTTLAEPLPWENSFLVKDDLQVLKDHFSGNLVVFGSGVLVQELLRQGLVDEFVLQIHPLVLGTGRRLFPDGGVPAALRLADSLTTGTGVIVATYTATG